MDPSNIQILCCPLCKGQLQVHADTIINERITAGGLLCRSCDKVYRICEGIPNLYVSDDEAIRESAETGFPELTLTPQEINQSNCPYPRRRTFDDLVAGRMLPALLIVFGWILLFGAGSEIVLQIDSSHFNETLLISQALLLALIFFGVDYYAYRRASKTNYVSSLCTLRELSDSRKLSEYDIRAAVTDHEEDFSFEGQRDFVTYKGAWVRSVLDNLGSNANRALEVGCGGSLHKPASQPYFDHGYSVLGVDISEDYIHQFVYEFNTEGVLANSLALPFKPNTFDLVGFTDVLEHLHHPLLGLVEAQRVLTPGGIILLSTNNRCAINSFRCLNPLIFAEKIISLRYDRILSPRNLLGTWMDFQFYHIEFSKREIAALLKTAGFSVLSLETRWPYSHRRIEDNIFRKFPILRYLCGEFFVVAFKNYSSNP